MKDNNLALSSGDGTKRNNPRFSRYKVVPHKTDEANH